MPREKLFNAIANLENIQYNLGQLSGEALKNPGDMESIEECRKMIKEALENLAGVDIRLEIDSYSTLDEE